VIFRGGLEVFCGGDKDTLIYCATHIKRHIPLVLFSTNGGTVFVFNFLMKKDHYHGMFSNMGRI
jgi:hypothetical protein